MGEPNVLPCLTPDKISARSFSIFILPPEPYPFCLLDISFSMKSSLIDRFEGMPSRITLNPFPCDSPAVKNLNFPIFFLNVYFFMPTASSIFFIGAFCLVTSSKPLIA